MKAFAKASWAVPPTTPIALPCRALASGAGWLRSLRTAKRAGNLEIRCRDGKAPPQICRNGDGSRHHVSLPVVQGVEEHVEAADLDRAGEAQALAGRTGQFDGEPGRIAVQSREMQAAGNRRRRESGSCVWPGVPAGRAAPWGPRSSGSSRPAPGHGSTRAATPPKAQRSPRGLILERKRATNVTISRTINRHSLARGPASIKNVS